MITPERRARWATGQLKEESRRGMLTTESTAMYSSTVARFFWPCSCLLEPPKYKETCEAHATFMGKFSSGWTASRENSELGVSGSAEEHPGANSDSHPDSWRLQCKDPAEPFSAFVLLEVTAHTVYIKYNSTNIDRAARRANSKFIAKWKSCALQLRGYKEEEEKNKTSVFCSSDSAALYLTTTVVSFSMELLQPFLCTLTLSLLKCTNTQIQLLNKYDFYLCLNIFQVIQL